MIDASGKPLPKLVAFGCCSCLLLVCGCSADDTSTSVSDAQQAQESAAELVDEAEDTLENLGSSLEAVEQQVADLKTERNELTNQVEQQREQIEQLKEKLSEETEARKGAEARVSSLMVEKARLEGELARERNAPADAEKRPTEPSRHEGGPDDGSPPQSDSPIKSKS